MWEPACWACTQRFRGTLRACRAKRRLTAGNAAGILGRATSSNAAVGSAAVKGINSGKGNGVLGSTTGYSGIGVHGIANNGSQAKGVYGQTTSGYAGYFDAAGELGWGVFGTGGQYGAYFTSGKTGAYAAGTDTGVKGQATSTSGRGVWGVDTNGGYGGYFEAGGQSGIGVSGSGPTGVYGESSAPGGYNAGVRGVGTNNALAARFDGETLLNGPTQVQGDLVMAGGYVRVWSGVGPPVASACDDSFTDEGRIIAYHGTLYVCNGSAWVAQR